MALCSQSPGPEAAHCSQKIPLWQGELQSLGLTPGGAGIFLDPLLSLGESFSMSSNCTPKAYADTGGWLLHFSPGNLVGLLTQSLKQEGYRLARRPQRLDQV